MNPILPTTLLLISLSTFATGALATPVQKSKSFVTRSFVKITAPVARHAKRVTSIAMDDAKELSFRAREVVMFSLTLLQTGYVWGGKSVDEGLDCSGLVSLVFKEAADIPLEGNAATLATKGKKVARHQLQTGDLVFFNTMNRKYSHVGIYLGDNEFIHSPNSNSSVRVEKLTNTYWSKRFEMGRTLSI